MTFESYIKSRLMDLVIDEAYTNGGVEPMIAVAQTIANRVKAGWQGGDWLRVIDSAPEYRGTIPSKLFTRVDPKEGSFRELMRRIDDVYYGVADDSNINSERGKPLYYAEVHNINREWFTTHILEDLDTHPRLAKVGQLTFFG